MNRYLKRLSDQVMVITGASSGIGLTTARMAAARGARLVLAARNEAVLRELVAEIRDNGGGAAYAVADVARESDVQRIADVALERFGGFDSWVNNASVTIFGRIEAVPLADQRRLFDVNYWGVVHGSLVAVRHLRLHGGALVNVGSLLSDCAAPMQGPYSAAKHAVKGFTDALRAELEMDGAPVSVTLIKPASIDTPIKEHARNYMAFEPKLPPPSYAPELVAKAILHAARYPVRDLYVGGAAKAIAMMGRWVPRLSDRVLEVAARPAQQTGVPAGAPSRDSLYAPSEDGAQRSRHPQFMLNNSLYTSATMHPWASAAIAIGMGAAATALLRLGRGRSPARAA